jgi:hypothetical protein
MKTKLILKCDCHHIFEAVANLINFFLCFFNISFENRNI